MVLGALPRYITEITVIDVDLYLKLKLRLIESLRKARTKINLGSCFHFSLKKKQKQSLNIATGCK